MHDPDDDELPERPSKSQRKRDMHRLQDLGARLAALRPDQWTQLPMDAGLRQALEELRRIRSREAHRRQLQFIGRLMRNADAEALETALARLQSGSIAQTRLLHTLEQWRDRLIEEGDPAVAELVAEHPQALAQELRQLIRNARRERELDKPPAAARKLFRYLRETLAEGEAQ
jgi:ribosome-associated protein